MCQQTVRICEACGTETREELQRCDNPYNIGGQSCVNYVELPLTEQCKRADCLAMPRRPRDEQEVRREVERLSTRADGTTNNLWSEVMVQGTGQYLPGGLDVSLCHF